MKNLQRSLGRVAAAMFVAGLLGAQSVPAQGAPASRDAGQAPLRAASRGATGAGDATVVAIVDFNFVPYHWDFVASKMPQASDADPSNDLPLEDPPHTWLPGFPDPNRAFKTYNRFDLTLEERDRKARLDALDAADKKKWDNVKRSTAKKIHYYWMPGTKVIGAIEFGKFEKLHGRSSDHGVGTTSVSVGNLHGTCPECLLVFINHDNRRGAAALRWALSQPWIDVVSNSYGNGLAKVYNGPEEKPTLEATQRGQTVFFSAGNGIDNAYTVPNGTYLSSEKGPDWMITVGAVSPSDDNPYPRATRTSEHASYVGAGKPVDVAGVGLDYPSAYYAQTVAETGRVGFSGTSNAAPTVAGTYARALYLARRHLGGPSRMQRGGVIASGGGFTCGSARPTCELGDGVLYAAELRHRLLHGAVHTPAGMTTYAGGETPPVGEDEFLNEGHGTYFARESPDVQQWLKEFDRVVGPLEGRRNELRRPEGEREWMIVDSFCRQQVWGSWRGGYYVRGKTELPPLDPRYPVRAMLQETCPALVPPP